MHELINRKPDISQIVPESGLSGDYRNEWFGVISTLEAGDLELLGESCTEKDGLLIMPYEMRYPESQFFNVVNNKNKQAISRLNQLVSEANEAFRKLNSGLPDSVSWEELKELVKSLYLVVDKIIIGEDE